MNSAGTTVPPSAPDAGHRLDDARRHLAAGELAAAEAALDDVAARDPRAAGLHAARGELLEKQGRDAEAAVSLAAALAEDPRDARSASRCAACLIRLRRVEEAVAVLRAAPEEPAVLLALGSALSLAGDDAAALERFAALKRIHPTHPGLHAAEGGSWLKLGRWEPAAEALALAIAARPKARSARRRLALALERLGRAAEAVAVLRAGLRLHPADPSLLLALAGLLAAAGAHEEALAAWERVAAGPPDRSLLNTWSAVAAAGHGTAAGDALRRALRARPEAPAGALAHARRLRRSGNPEGALAVLRACVAEAPDDVEVLVEAGGLLLRAGGEAELAEALAATRQAGDPRLAHLHAHLAEARGDHAGAAVHLRHALDAAPADAGLRVRLVRALWRSGQGEAVLPLLGDAAGEVEMPLLKEGFPALLAVGGLERAAAALEAAARRWPGHATVFRLRAQLAEAEGDVALACDIMRQAVAAHPGDERLQLGLCRKLKLAGRLDELAVALAAAVAALPGSARLGLEWVEALRRDARLEEADAALERLHPDDQHVARALGEAAAARGDDAAALAAFRRGLAATPGSLRLRRRLVDALRRMNAHEEVLAELRRHAPREPALRLDLVRSLLLAGEGEEAVAVVQAWEPGGGDAGLRRLHAAALLAAAAHDHARCIALCEQMLAMDPANDWAGRQVAASLGFSFRPDEAFARLLDIQRRNLAAGRPAAHCLSPLRTSLGQVFNEMRLEPDECRVLAEACAGPPEGLAASAASLLAARPGSTAAALALFIGLARSGRLFSEARPLAVARVVPRVIHQFWDADPPPPDVAAMMARLREQNPDHDHVLWNSATAEDFLREHATPRALAAFRAAPHIAGQVDIFRLAVLVARGGIYVDADDHGRRPIAPLVPPGFDLVLYQEDIGSIANNFIAAAPGHPLLREALAQACDNVLPGVREAAWLVTGPGVLTRVLARATGAGGLPAGVLVQSRNVYRQYIIPHRPFQYKRTALHWSNTL